jgi:hypothetical protein
MENQQRLVTHSLLPLFPRQTASMVSVRIENKCRMPNDRRIAAEAPAHRDPFRLPARRPA